MYEVDDRWEPTVQTSHDVVTEVDVWRDGELLIEGLPVVEGWVTRDYGATTTLSAEVTVGDPSLLPVSRTDPVSPYGSFLVIRSGVRFPDRSSQLLTLFEGPITSCPTWPTKDSFVIHAEGWLRMVQDDRFLAPYSPVAGGSMNTELVNLLKTSVPNVPTIFTGVGVKTVPDGLLWEEDRLQAMDDMAKYLGGVVRQDPRLGVFNVEKELVPDPNAAPVRSFIHGEGNVLLARTDPLLTREEVYNSVVAYNSDIPEAWAQAKITDTTNPIHWGGPFGRKTLYYASPVLTTAAQAQSAADTRLAGLNGRSRKIDASILPDCSIEPGDHIYLEWPAPFTTQEKFTEKAQVRKVTNPLGPGPTTLELRGVGLI